MTAPKKPISTGAMEWARQTGQTIRTLGYLACVHGCYRETAQAVMKVTDKPPWLTLALVVITVVVVPIITTKVNEWRGLFSADMLIGAFPDPKKQARPRAEEEGGS